MIMDVYGGNPTFNRPVTNEIPFAASMVTRTAACKTTSMIVSILMIMIPKILHRTHDPKQVVEMCSSAPFNASQAVHVWLRFRWCIAAEAASEHTGRDIKRTDNQVTTCRHLWFWSMLITLHCWAIWSLWLVVWYVHRILTTVCPCEGKMCRCCWPFAHSIWFCIFSYYAMELVRQRSESWATMGWGHGEVYLTGHVKCSFSYFLDLQSVHLFISSCVEDLSLMSRDSHKSYAVYE